MRDLRALAGPSHPSAQHPTAHAPRQDQQCPSLRDEHSASDLVGKGGFRHYPRLHHGVEQQTRTALVSAALRVCARVHACMFVCVFLCIHVFSFAYYVCRYMSVCVCVCVCVKVMSPSERCFSRDPRVKIKP